MSGFLTLDSQYVEGNGMTDLVLFTNLASAKGKEFGVACGGSRDGAKDVEQPWNSAHYAQHGHVRVDAFDGGMLDAGFEVIEVFAETDFAHDVEAEEHAPC
jgi:hypothetical protein